MARTAAPATEPARGDTRQLRAEMAPEDMPRRTRRSTLNDVGMPTDIPERFKKPGWAYAYFPLTVMNEPVEPWLTSAIEDGGWEPVRTEEMPGWPSRNYQGATIIIGGQQLYSRPDYLEQESREEDVIRARRQTEGRLESARVPDPRAPHTYDMKPRDEVFVRRGLRASDSGQVADEVIAARHRARQDREMQDPLGGSLTTSADDISPEERADIAAQHRAGRGRFAG